MSKRTATVYMIALSYGYGEYHYLGFASSKAQGERLIALAERGRVTYSEGLSCDKLRVVTYTLPILL